MILSYIQSAGNEGESVSTYPHCVFVHISHLYTPTPTNLPNMPSTYMAETGIWTKHLKAKTELHQTVIDRCIKSLMQKQLIKAVKSVKVCDRHLRPLLMPS